ncbi:hypothetical protein ACUOCP_36470, partial [Escherichia sp. R-CC3]
GEPIGILTRVDATFSSGCQLMINAIQFDWYPTSDSTDPVDMRMYLRCQGDAISETWLYQYFPPAPDKRQYVDDRVMS